MPAQISIQIGCRLVLPLRTALAFLVRMEGVGYACRKCFGGGVPVRTFSPSSAPNIWCEAVDERVKKSSMVGKPCGKLDGVHRRERREGGGREWRTEQKIGSQNGCNGMGKFDDGKTKDMRRASGRR